VAVKDTGGGVAGNDTGGGMVGDDTGGGAWRGARQAQRGWGVR